VDWYTNRQSKGSRYTRLFLLKRVCWINKKGGLSAYPIDSNDEAFRFRLNLDPQLDPCLRSHNIPQCRQFLQCTYTSDDSLGMHLLPCNLNKRYFHSILISHLFRVLSIHFLLQNIAIKIGGFD
jgi:hypothetical protein